MTGSPASRQRPGVSDRTEEFRAIYSAHHAALCAYFARRVGRGEVEDLVAETFVVAWRKLPRKIEHPLPWLYAVAGKVLANHRRKAARRDGVHIGDRLPAPAPRPGRPRRDTLRPPSRQCIRAARRARPRGDPPRGMGGPLAR